MLLRSLQAEEYGQPQEAATWDFLSLIYVHQPATEGSLAEVLHARNLSSSLDIPKRGASLMLLCQLIDCCRLQSLHSFVSSLWWLIGALTGKSLCMFTMLKRWSLFREWCSGCRSMQEC